MIKDRDRLVAAYDDAAGVTAEFNRNVLHVLNRELGADFVPDRFAHVARWNEADHRIEMWLRSLDECCVHVADLDLDIGFAAGEEMLTEISTKFSLDALRDELEAAAGGRGSWVADGDEFVLTLARRPEPAPAPAGRAAADRVDGMTSSDMERPSGRERRTVSSREPLLPGGRPRVLRAERPHRCPGRARPATAPSW